MAADTDTNLCTSHLGACAELLASTWLLKLGYEVFRNVSGAGPADIVAWRPCAGEIHLIDVKSMKDARFSPKTEQYSVVLGSRRTEGVHLLLVIGGEIIGFFRQDSADYLPVRYWPLGVAPPALPTGYNEEEQLSPFLQFVEWEGRRMPLRDLAREKRISLSTLRARLNIQKLPLELAVALPVDRNERRAQERSDACVTPDAVRGATGL